MPIDMLMGSRDSLMWTVSSTSVQHVFAPSKPKMLLAATLLLVGQPNSSIKAYPSTSPSLVLLEKYFQSISDWNQSQEEVRRQDVQRKSHTES